MKSISSAIAMIALILLSGCQSETEVWEEVTGEIDGAIEVQIAVRSEPYRPGDAIEEGDFVVVSSNVFPIHSTGGPGHVVSDHDGVVMEFQWEDVRLHQNRIDQHHSFETQISFDNFLFVIKNQLVRPDGIAHRLGSGPDSKTVSSEFDLMFAPITYSTGNDGDERAIVIRARYLPESEPVKDLTISQTAGHVTEQDG